MLLTWVPLPPVSAARNLGKGVGSPAWGGTPRRQRPSLLGYQECQEEATTSVRVKSALKWKPKRARDYCSEKWPRNGDSGTQDFSVPFPPARRLGWAPVPRATLACVPGREGRANTCVKSAKAPPPLAFRSQPEPCSLSPGLPPAAASGQDPGAGGGDQAHHSEGQEPAAAAVGAARVRVCSQHPGQRAEGAGPALQQLQRAMPEHLCECPARGPGRRAPPPPSARPCPPGPARTPPLFSSRA